MDFQAQLRQSLATLHLPPSLPPLDKDRALYHLGKVLERYAENLGDADLMRAAKLALHGARLKTPELLGAFAAYYTDYFIAEMDGCIPRELLSTVLLTFAACCTQAGYAAADIERRGDRTILEADTVPLDIAV